MWWLEFLGVGNKYKSLRRKGPVVSMSSHQQGTEQKNKLGGTFPVFVALAPVFFLRQCLKKSGLLFYLFAPFESDLVLQ